MSDTVLLRFRDLTAGVETIEAHNEIARLRGRVLWGWWKKPLEPFPDPALSIISKELGPNSIVLLIDSGTDRVYSAPLFAIHYQLGGELLPAPGDIQLCPEYYRQRELVAWFEIGPIQLVGESRPALATYVFSTENRTASRHTSTALERSAIGQGLADTNFLDSNVSLWFLTHVDDLGIRSRGSLVKAFDATEWPCSGSVILHLSDLHFGAKHAFRNPLGKPHIGKELLLDALLEDLEVLGLRREVALVLVSGDLSWTGSVHEFDNARVFLEALAKELGLHRSQVLLVPGNHDIEWIQDGTIDENAELNYSDFLQKFYGIPPVPKSFARLARFSIQGRRVAICCINSCRIESKKNAGLGFVGREQLGEIARRLGPHDGGTELRIAMLHHHLLPVNFIEDFPYETEDSRHVSLTLDAESVLRFLIAGHVNLVLHGHQHQPYVSEIRRIMTGFVGPFPREGDLLDGKVWVLGAGSVGVDRSHLSLVGRLSYNLLRLQRGREGVLQLETRVHSPVGPGFTTFQRTDLAI